MGKQDHDHDEIALPALLRAARTVYGGAVRKALARADRNEGRRGVWLRTLDRLGLGFDS